MSSLISSGRFRGISMASDLIGDGIVGVHHFC